MFGLTFLNPAVLWGLAAVSVPVLIHLLFRIRRQTVAFSSIEFILASSVRQQSRTRLKELLLLLMRVLVIALIVAAFARPAIRHSSSNSYGVSTSCVIVLDDTLSMQRRLRSGSAFDWARRTALDEIRDLPPGSRVTLVPVSGPVEGPLTPKVAAGRLRALQATWRSAPLAPAVARGLLAFSEGGGNRTLVVISDFQRPALEGLSEALRAVPDSVAIHIRATPDEAAFNASVLALSSPDYLRDALTAKVAATGITKPVTERFELFEGAPKARYSTEVTFANEATRVVEIAADHLPRGAVLTARLGQPDALTADNERYRVHGVMRRLQILCVEEDPPTNAFAAVSRFVRTALCPESPKTGDGYYYHVTTIPRAELSPERLRGVDVLLLCGLSGLTAQQVETVEKLIAGGAGCVLFTGPKSEPALYNGRGYRNGTGFIPAPIQQVQSIGTSADQFWFLTRLKSEHPALQSFSGPGITDPSAANFWGRVKLGEPGPVGPGEGEVDRTNPSRDKEVLARFDDELPAVVASRFGQGRVVMVASTADRAWNDMPLHKFFVPFIHDLAVFTAGKRPQSFPSLTVGEPFRLALDGTADAGTFAVAGPDRKSFAPELADGAVVVAGFERPGVYTLSGRLRRDGKSVAVKIPIAVNVDPSESVLGREVPAPEADRNARVAEAGPGGTGAQRAVNVAHWFILCAMALLCVELFVANRAGFH